MVLLSIVSILIYGSVQQVLRLGANDPQIQIAEDITTALNGGQQASMFNPGRSINMAKSLAPFIMIFNEGGKLVNGSANLDGTAPVPPKGIFSYTKEHNEDRFTWQPKKGVRAATVTIHYKNSNESGYVLVGRSLKEIEIREDALLLKTVVGWFVGMITTLMAVLAFEIPLNKRKK